MREMLFRGQRLDNRKWVYGFPIFNSDRTKCLFFIDVEFKSENQGKEWGFDTVPVDPITVGQFTGFYDENDIKIFEDDILDLFDDSECECPQNHDDGCDGTIKCDCQYTCSPHTKCIGRTKTIVEFNGGAFVIDVNSPDCDFTAIGWVNSAIGFDPEITVIGNIHDNPELLEGVK